MQESGGRRTVPMSGVIVFVVIVALLAAGFVYYEDHHPKDYANLTANQGFLSTNANVTNFVQWQESSGGVLTGSIQTTTKTAGQPEDPLDITSSVRPSVSTVSQYFSGVGCMVPTSC